MSNMRPRTYEQHVAEALANIQKVTTGATAVEMTCLSRTNGGWWFGVQQLMIEQGGWSDQQLANLAISAAHQILQGAAFNIADGDDAKKDRIAALLVSEVADVQRATIGHNGVTGEDFAIASEAGRA